MYEAETSSENLCVDFYCMLFLPSLPIVKLNKHSNLDL